MGADSLCIKDMAGLLTPVQCRRSFVKALKEAVDLRLISIRITPPALHP